MKKIHIDIGGALELENWIKNTPDAEPWESGYTNNYSKEKDELVCSVQGMMNSTPFLTKWHADIICTRILKRKYEVL